LAEPAAADFVGVKLAEPAAADFGEVKARDHDVDVRQRAVPATQRSAKSARQVSGGGRGFGCTGQQGPTVG
jgi:hypothetical protein